MLTDTTLPTVVSVTPTDGATEVITNVGLTVLFDKEMDAASIDGTTIELHDGADNLVAATVSYDAATKTATLTPTAPLVGDDDLHRAGPRRNHRSTCDGCVR